MFGTAIAYRTYIASLLTFILQLDSLPSTWVEEEARALERLVPGLRHWSAVRDLHCLGERGFPRRSGTSPPCRSRSRCG